MKIIDLDAWDRTEHYQFYRTIDYPQYSICANVDITRFLKMTKKNELPFYYAMIYAATAALNEVDAFKYRIQSDNVVMYDTIHPSFTDLSKGSELFKFVTASMEKDIRTFAETVKAKSARQSTLFVPDDIEGRDDMTYITCIPWISFTHLTHTLSFNKDESIPRLSWGKYFKDGRKTLMPFSVQAHHAFVDGIHMGRYYDCLQQYINEENVRQQ